MDERHQTENGSNKHNLLIFITIVVFLLVTLHDKLLPLPGKYLTVNDHLHKTDAIFVFGGSIPNRIIEAVELYRLGYSALIIISKYPKPDGYNYIQERGISYPERS